MTDGNRNEQERILDRVRKMLALANDKGATEGERDTALAMAHKLLAKHQLDLEDVDARARERDDPRVHFAMEGWGMLWCRQVRQTVAKLFMVKYIQGRKINATRMEHHFVGREAAATTAAYMADYIIRGLIRETAKLYGHHLNAPARAFNHGAADRLWIRVCQMMDQQEKDREANPGTHLALVDAHKAEAAENDAFAKAHFGSALVAVKDRKQADVDREAYAAGSEHGKTIGLNTQVANKKGTQALGADPVVLAGAVIWASIKANGRPDL